MNHKLEQDETEIDDLLEEYDFSKAKPGRHRGFKGALVRVFEDNTEQVIELRPRNTINLSPEAIRLIVESLEYRIEAYQRRLEAESLDKSKVSQVTNDLMVLVALSQELKKSLEMPALFKE